LCTGRAISKVFGSDGWQMTIEAWALFCATETLLCLNPGPSALLVISLGLTRGQAAGVRATVGVLAANAIYFALAASGLVAVHSLSAEAFLAIKWAGAGYLIWLGGRMLLRSFRPRQDAMPSLPSGSPRRAFWQGFVTQGANPNLLVYFTAILPQFVDAAHPLPGQVAILAASSFAIEFTVLSVYAALAFRAGQRAAPRFRLAVERLGGGLLIAAGAGLATLRRE
jgi:homoserine/homoserine lactone efflux protein